MNPDTISRNPKKAKRARKSSRKKAPSEWQSTWQKVPRSTGLYKYVPSSTYFAIVRRSGTFHRESLKTTDLAFAKRKLEALRLRLDRTDPRYGKISFVKWLTNVYAPMLRGSVSTLTNKRCIIDRVKQTWVAARTQPMRELKPSDVERWLNKEFGEWSAAYYNSALSVIRDSLEKAKNDQVIVSNPADGVKWLKRNQPMRLTPTFDQFQQLVADIRSQVFNADARDSGDFIEAMGLLGLGQAELASMKQEHVDLESGRIMVYRSKTRTPFHIPIFPQARALTERLCKGKKSGQLLFPIEQSRKALANACDRLGFPNFTQRSLRRMFVTRCIELGVDVKVIAQWQGHKDQGVLILRTYSHVRPEHSNRMAALLTTDRPENVVPMTRAKRLS
jgi:integrase